MNFSLGLLQINTIGHTPYYHGYGQQVFLPIEFQVDTFRIVAKLGINLSKYQKQRLP